MRGTDRGVSDMIAFVIVFSLIITSVGITYTFGYSTLSDYQEDEQKRNAERAFVALSNNVGEIESGQIEARAGELRLAGGRLSVEDDTQITVSSPSWSLSNGTEARLSNQTARSFVYEFEGTKVEYENGAVFRQDGDGRHIMLAEPEYRCGDSYASVSIVQFLPNDGALSSDGTVQVLAEQENAVLLYPANRTGTNDATVDHVTVTVQSDKAEAWEEYFDDTGWTVVDGSGQERTFKCEPDGGSNQIDVYVRKTRISIDYFA